MLPIVIVAASLLMAVPGLSWGWWTMLGGQGNPVFGSSDATIGTVWEWIIPLGFMALLIPALPLFAFAEERLFRQGAEHWSMRRRAFKVVQFGLIHAVIGIPIGAALALSIGGAYFMLVYVRAFGVTGSRYRATLESTRAHTAYNGFIVVVVVVAARVAGRSLTPVSLPQPVVPRCYRHPDREGGRSCTRCGRAGMRGLPRAGGGRVALPGLREGGTARREHPGEVGVVARAHARHVRAHRCQRAALHRDGPRRSEGVGAATSRQLHGRLGLSKAILQYRPRGTSTAR